MNTQRLSVAQLSYCYTHRAVVDKVSFHLAAGQYYALLGPNGAGKSTLFALLCQLLHPEHGEIKINGIDVRRRPQQALRQIGMVYQQSTLDLDLSVRQNLLYHAALHGIAKAQAMPRIDTELARLGMSEHLHTPIRRLNGGHRRRVEIARALLHQPAILLLDEATVGLDQGTRDGINRHLRTLCQQQGITILSATHLVDEVQAEDQLLVIVDGQIRLQQQCKAALATMGFVSPQALYQHFHDQRCIA